MTDNNNNSNNSSTTSTTKSENATNMITLGDRMKAYEKKFLNYLDPNLPFVIRLDGHGFSKFTKGFKKPFDDRITNAMVNTAADLLEKFNANSAYVASDEISLLFRSTIFQNDEEDLERANKESEKKKKKNKNNNNNNDNDDSNDNKTQFIYNGKITKLISLTAGFASARFNFHICNQSYLSTESTLESKVKACLAYFDSRLFSISETESLNNIIWRVRDTRKNSKAMLAQSFFSTSQLHKLSSNQMIEKVKAEKGIDWHTEIDASNRSGCLIKKKLILKETIHPKTNEPIQFERRVVCKAAWDDLCNLSPTILIPLLFTRKCSASLSKYFTPVYI